MREGDLHAKGVPKARGEDIRRHWLGDGHMSGEEERAPKRRENLPIHGILREDGVLIPASEDIEGLKSRGYGTPKNDDLILAYYEALYLLSKGILEVKDEETGKKLSFEDLLERAKSVNEDAWVKYLVYRDL
ncbi:MAG TPA: hypothetical protein ENG65_04055, partial [Candidatus Bathyarchaeota archaeon]|nr:hypothetical protein [Candidatus Bathyarchaeota archaeon]